ncbi:syntaxin binding protein 1, partial [Linderina macrospora]
MKLARLANLDRNARATVQNMGFIVRWAHALNLVRELSKKRPQQPKSAGGAGASKWSLASIRTAGSSGSSLGDEPKPFDLSRYVPVAKHILEQCIEGWLSEDVFPYVVPPERPTAQAAMGSPRSGSLRGSAGSRVASGQPDRSGSPASGMWSSLVSSVVSNNSTEPPLPSGPPRQVRSLRSTKPTWQKRDSTPGSSANVSSMASGSPRTPQLDAPSPGAGYGNQGQRNSQHARPRVVLFVIGGVTYSEVRAADEIARKYGREVIIGSTHMLTPHAYLQDTSTLNFELVDERGRVLDIKPSFYTLGYGGPAEIDPLNSYVPPAKGGGEAKKQPPKTARSTSAGPPESYPRQQSRQQQQPPPSMSQHRSAGRVSSHQSSSSGGGSGGGYDRATSEPRA